MDTCERLKVCPFFQDYLNEASEIRQMYVDRCCRGDHEKCARFTVLKKCGSEGVPPDLYPLEFERARKIIEAHENAGLASSRECHKLGEE